MNLPRNTNRLYSVDTIKVSLDIIGNSLQGVLSKGTVKRCW